MISSSDPGGMMRASTAPHDVGSSPALANAGPVPPNRDTSPSYGSTRPSCPRAASARQSWSVCQPPPCRAARIAMRTAVLVGLLPDQHRDAARGEVRQVRSHRLEPRRGGTLFERLLRVEPQVRLAIQRGRLAIGGGPATSSVPAGSTPPFWRGSAKRTLRFSPTIFRA